MTDINLTPETLVSGSASIATYKRDGKLTPPKGIDEYVMIQLGKMSIGEVKHVRFSELGGLVSFDSVHVLKGKVNLQLTEFIDSTEYILNTIGLIENNHQFPLLLSLPKYSFRVVCTEDTDNVVFFCRSAYLIETINVL